MPYEKGATSVSALDEQLQERDLILQELKAQLLLAQAKMKITADAKRREVQFQEGDLVYLKVRPYRRKTLAARPNEKLAPKFYGHFAVEKKIGLVAYKLALPPTCNIHPIFHVYQLRKVEGGVQAVNEVPKQLNEKLEMLVEPEALLGIRPRVGSNIKGLDVLIQWKGLLPLEATWESYEMMRQQFPLFHLEDKVNLMGGCNDRTDILLTYQRHNKMNLGSKGINQGEEKHMQQLHGYGIC